MMIINLVLLLFTGSCVSSFVYDQRDVAAGIKLSANEHMLVTASNAFSNFAILFDLEKRHTPEPCDNLRYNTTDRFVHSVAVVGPANYTSGPDEYVFVFTAEEMSTVTPHVCIVTISRSTCAATTQCTKVAQNNSHQEYFLIGVDSYGLFAYGFTSSFVFKLHLPTNTMMAFLTTDQVWPSLNFSPRALDMNNASWAFVSGYGYSNIRKKDYAALGCVVELDTLLNTSCVTLITEPAYIIPSELAAYSELHEMSVAVRGFKILVGVHRLNAVIVLDYRVNLLNVTRVHSIAYSDSASFGRGVDWADDQTFAVLVYESAESLWSKSQLFFYDESLVTASSPLFTFPNNQQILGTRLLNPYFSRFVINDRGSMAILTSRGEILLIPPAPPGQTSIWIETTALVYVFHYEQQPCIGGMYKNTTGLGPCQVCPSGTRLGGVTCLPCSDYPSRSFCPLASLVDLDKSNISTYSQALAYPDSPDTTDIEDLLLENMFQIQSEPNCLILSPLFWTLIVGALCSLVCFAMILLKHLNCKQYDSYRKSAERIFQHTDLIGEGELWVGGLVTLTIVVLIAFSYWFLVGYVHRYPIEDMTEPAKFTCDRSILNAKFTTGLEVISLPKSVEAQPIFTSLDQQQFHLTIELINTGFLCDNITAQENLIDNKYVRLPTKCLQSPSNATTAVTVTFPNHLTTVQMNMTGPYWIAGFRLCIRGEGRQSGGVTLQALDFCRFFFADQQNIDRSTVVSITFVKSINMTKSLTRGDSTVYSGLWVPTFDTPSFRDADYYHEFGNYLRYTSSSTTIRVSIDERSFYIKNIQEPILRAPQAAFHALLFTFLCIELFAFPFILGKLFLLPGIACLRRRWRKFCRRSSAESVEETSAQIIELNQKMSIIPVENTQTASSGSTTDESISSVWL